MKIEISLEHFIKSYWNYYINLEEQLSETKRYVEFHEVNFKTFSFEYLKLLQATCSEIDTVAKIIAEYFNPEFKSLKNKNIQKWGYELQNVFPNIESYKILFNGDKVIQPWKNCIYEKYKDRDGKIKYKLKENSKTTIWWIAYNKIKHERTTFYEEGQANLHNVVLSLAALYSIESLFIQKLLEEAGVKKQITASRLFVLQ